MAKAKPKAKAKAKPKIKIIKEPVEPVESVEPVEPEPIVEEQPKNNILKEQIDCTDCNILMSQHALTYIHKKGDIVKGHSKKKLTKKLNKK